MSRITQEQAMAAASRLIRSHFGKPDGARMTIPAKSTDDDILILSYITQAEQRIQLLEGALRVCGDQFADYTRQHRAKRTADGDEKALTNEAYLDYCSAAAVGRDLPPIPRRT